VTPGRARRAVGHALSLVVLVATAQGTSCVGPAVNVFHRFELSGRLDSAFTLPRAVELSPLGFSVPRSRHSWWSMQAALQATCPGFQLYTLDRLPQDVPNDSLLPTYFEASLEHGQSPALMVWYSYRLPLRRADRPPPDSVGRVFDAELEEALARKAERLARLLLRGSGADPVTATATRDRTFTYDEIRARCRADTRAAPVNGSPGT
jgi:hypothetical protein